MAVLKRNACPASVRTGRKNGRQSGGRRHSRQKKKKDSGHQQPQEAEEISPVLQMIKQKMEERIKDESLYGEGALSGTSDPGIPGNPLIEALPEIWASDTVVELLSEEAPYHDGERMLDARYRMHCIQRLFHYFQPLEQHIDIEQRISRCIRQGYLNRNPCTREYARILAEGYEALQRKERFLFHTGIPSQCFRIHDHRDVRRGKKHCCRKNPFPVSPMHQP